MDKVGHMWDAYNIAKPLGKSFRWSGHDGKKSALYGAGIAFLYQTTIEVLDAFSAEWGFSTGDLICNTSGVGLYLFQELGWKEQRMVLKYSFHRTQYADYRPDLLGKSLPENILKDYNGLTYWLCINPRSFLSNSSTFPAWLSIGLGYGAQGMTGGISNPSVVNGKPIPDFERYRQFYLSLDLDLSRVHFKSRFLTSVARVINIIHLPAPTVEFSRGRKTVFHLLYF